MARFAIGFAASGSGQGMADPVAGAVTAKTDIATAITDFNTAMADLVTAFGVVTYSSTTLQFTGTFSTTVSGTNTAGNTLLTALDAVGTALLAVNTDLANAPAASDDIVISYEATKIGTASILRRLLQAASWLGGGLTP